MAEYVLVATLIAVVSVGVVTQLGQIVMGMFLRVPLGLL